MTTRLPTIKYDRGTLLLVNFGEELASEFDDVVFDERTNAYRAQARHYRDIVMTLHRAGREYVDDAKNFSPTKLVLKKPISPFPHQRDALNTWQEHGRRGIVELPTGAGKTVLAVLAIANVQLQVLRWIKRLPY